MLLEYFRQVGQRPPHDIVAFFAEAGIDIDGGRVLAGGSPADPLNPPIYATGPLRSLEERVRIAEQQLGAVAYVPTVRKKPTEEAAAKALELADRLGIDLRTGLPANPQPAVAEPPAPEALVVDAPAAEEPEVDE